MHPAGGLSSEQSRLAAAHSFSLRVEVLLHVLPLAQCSLVPGRPTVLEIRLIVWHTEDLPQDAHEARGEGQGLNRRPHRTSPRMGLRAPPPASVWTAPATTRAATSRSAPRPPS